MNKKRDNDELSNTNRPSIKKISNDKFDALSQKSTSMEWDSAHKARQEVLQQEQKRRQNLEEEMDSLNKLASQYCEA